MKNAKPEVPKILALLSSCDEATALERILEPEKWDVQFEWRFREAEAALLSNSFNLVICTSRFDEGHQWTDVLASVRQARTAPVLIVADRLADDALWAEVLNLGGYDVLMMPFDQDEVLRVIRQACRSTN